MSENKPDMRQQAKRFAGENKKGGLPTYTAGGYSPAKMERCWGWPKIELDVFAFVLPVWLTNVRSVLWASEQSKYIIYLIFVVVLYKQFGSVFY